MNDITDPRSSLSEWILDAYDVLYTHSLKSDDPEDTQSVSREQALKILLNTEKLALEPEDANYALTRLLERGYFYEVHGELHVTIPEN